jgi:hypothetical protein
MHLREGEEQLLRPSQEGAGINRPRLIVVILVQSLLQDILDGAVSRVSEGISTGAGGIESLLAVFVLEPDNTVHLTKVVQGVVVEQDGDGLFHFIADGRRLVAAA